MEDVIKRNNAIDKIRDITKEGKLIPFVGAGFSANIQGYPTWSQSVDQIKTRFAGCSAFPTDYLEAYQYAYWKAGEMIDGDILSRLEAGKKTLVNDILRGILQSPLEGLEERRRTLDKKAFDKELEQHDLLRQFKKIYTTNWDRLIEYVCDVRDTRYESYYATIGMHPYGSKYHLNKEITSDNNIVKIIKYHGCISDKKGTSIIASTADYNERISSLYMHPLDQELYWDMREKTIMFIGYSLSDINIKYVMNQVLFEAWRQQDDKDPTQFYLIDFANSVELGDDELNNVLNYWSQCCKFSPVYLFEKSHVYHKIIKLRGDLATKNDKEHDNCITADSKTIKERLTECKAQLVDMAEDDKESFIPIHQMAGYVSDLETLIKSINNDESLLPKTLDLITTSLGSIIGRMRKESITNFLKYITSNNN